MPKASRKPARQRPLVENAADTRQIQRGQITEDDRRHQELADLKIVAGTREGRRFLFRLIQASGLFDISFRGGQPDVTAFHEGQRAIGKLVRDELVTLDQRSVGLMEAEHAQDVAEEQAIRHAQALDQGEDVPEDAQQDNAE